MKLDTLEDIKEMLDSNPAQAKVSYYIMSKVIDVLIKEIKELKKEG
mgnify:CR=1 FL=1